MADETRDAVYERLRMEIATADASKSAKSRDLHWATQGRTLGFARASDGRLELFFVGQRLWSGRPSLSRRLEYDEWSLEDGSALPATRLLLPNEPHFDQVAAWVCAELILREVDSDASRAFQACEDLIALALEKGIADSESVLGLCGELLFLDGLTRAAPHLTSSLALTAWKGHERSTRDFQFGELGIEVKTTTRQTSEHHIQGTHQVELGIAADGEVETDLRLLSLGVTWLPVDSAGFSLGALADAIRSRLDVDQRSEFDRRLASYLGSTGFMFEAGIDSDHLPIELRRPFGLSFARLYDLKDERIRLIRSTDLTDLMVIPESVSFSVRLPDSVDGTLNPVSELPTIVSTVLQRLR